MKIKIKLPKPAHEAPSSPQIVASIDDLLIEVLLHLPLKSLIQFKLVSKHWHSLIISPEFCLRQNPNPNQAIGIFLRDIWRPNDLVVDADGRGGFLPPIPFVYIPFSPRKSTNSPLVELNFKKDPSPTIVHSCNGLMLCYRCPDDNCRRRCYIYNPTINQFSTLPDIEGGWYLSNIRGICLAFDPAKSHYKVVCIRRSEHPETSSEDYAQIDHDHYYCHQIEVYSSETGIWRQSGKPFRSYANFERGVYWNGAIHWIQPYHGADSLCFNPDQDQMLRIMPTPPMSEGRDPREYYFEESGGHLHYAEDWEIEFNVYELKWDYSEWFVKYRVDISPIAAAYPVMTTGSYHAYSICCVAPGAKEEDDFLVLHIPGKVIKYNLVERSFETLHEFEIGEIDANLFYQTRAFQHIDSLCCV